MQSAGPGPEGLPPPSQPWSGGYPAAPEQHGYPSAAMPVHAQQPYGTPPGHAPMPGPAPLAPPQAEAPEDQEPGFFRSALDWIKEQVRERAGLVVCLAIGGLLYGGYRLYALRQPYEWSGSVEAKTASVGSRTGGRVKEILVREGEEVKAGAVLIVLEPGELEAKKSIAEADLEAAEATLEKVTNGARPDEIAQVQARLLEARAAAGREGSHAAQQHRDFERASNLYRGGAISGAEAESKSSAMRASGAGAAAAAARAKEMEAALKLLTGGARSEDLRVAKATVAVARAKLLQIAAQINELSIRASRDARVESLTVRPGDMLRPDAPAAKLLEKGQLYVRIYVPETQLGRIQPGQEVPIIVDSFPSRQFKGRVDHVNEVGEFTPRRLVTTEDRASEVFGARVTLLDGDRELRAGMVAFVHVPKR